MSSSETGAILFKQNCRFRSQARPECMVISKRNMCGQSVMCSFSKTKALVLILTVILHTVSSECPEGKFGQDCDESCPQNCLDEVCDQNDRTCTYGCSPGYRGSTCMKKCYKGKFGQDCAELCPQNCRAGVCDHITGKCTLGCLPGYIGSTCSIQCPEGKFGPKCSELCPQTCLAEVCDHIAGTCTHGCLPGYRGSSCRKQCPKGTFGFDCSESCPQNCLGVCDHITGTCTHGCSPGYRGRTCRTPCSYGTYGARCSQVCNPKCRQRDCHAVTGMCKNGCWPGYLGVFCDQECVPGTCKSGCDLGGECEQDSPKCATGLYGPRCSQVCSETCLGRDNPCNPIDGTCTYGCDAGFEGPSCHLRCEGGFYGEGCRETCSEHCAGNLNSCDHVRGTCLLGCEPGHNGSTCPQVEKERNETNIRTDPQQEKGSGGSGENAGAIAGGIIAVFIVAALAVAVGVFVWRRRKADTSKSDRTGKINGGADLSPESSSQPVGLNRPPQQSMVRSERPFNHYDLTRRAQERDHVYDTGLDHYDYPETYEEVYDIATDSPDTTKGPNQIRREIGTASSANQMTPYYHNPDDKDSAYYIYLDGGHTYTNH